MYSNNFISNQNQQYIYLYISCGNISHASIKKNKRKIANDKTSFENITNYN